MASSGLNKLSVQEAQNASLGQAGYKVIDQAVGDGNTGAVAAGVEYVAVTVIEGSSASIATTSVDTNAFPNLANPVPLGTTVFGRWSSVTITGTDCVAICYRG